MLGIACIREQECEPIQEEKCKKEKKYKIDANETERARGEIYVRWCEHDLLR